MKNLYIFVITSVQYSILENDNSIVFAELLYLSDFFTFEQEDYL